MKQLNKSRALRFRCIANCADIPNAFTIRSNSIECEGYSNVTNHFEVPVMPRGGARPGSGPKPRGFVAPPPTDAQVLWERERAEHEKVKREQREFNLAIKRREYLPREAQQQAAATALSVLTQSLRSLPDTLERRLALSPAVAEAIALGIDEALAELATAFRVMANE